MGREDDNGVSCDAEPSDMRRLELGWGARTDAAAESLNLRPRKGTLLPLEGETDLSFEGERDHHFLGDPLGGVMSPWGSARWWSKRRDKAEGSLDDAGPRDAGGDGDTLSVGDVGADEAFA